MTVYRLIYMLLTDSMHSCSEKNKKYAEQSAALVALYALGLIDSSKIKGNTAGMPFE